MKTFKKIYAPHSFNKYIFIMVILHFELIISQDFQSLNPNILEEDSSLYDVKVYENNDFITITKNRLYKGLNFELKGTFNDVFPKSTAFVTYNSDYLFAACTSNSLVALININTLEETEMFSYVSAHNNLELTNYYCSISYLNEYVYVAYVNKETATNQILLKIGRFLLNLDSGVPTPCTSYLIDTKRINEISSDNFRQISCEAIYRSGYTYYNLICGYVQFNSETNKYIYYAIGVDFPNDFMEEITVFESENLYYFKMSRIDNYYIRYLIGTYSFELYLKKRSNNYYVEKVPEESNNIFLSSFYSYNDLFYHYYEYIFHADSSDNINYNLYISTTSSNNHQLKLLNNKQLSKIIGYYDTINEKFIYI